VGHTIGVEIIGDNRAGGAHHHHVIYLSTLMMHRLYLHTVRRGQDC
jgi:hypothetical protein